jgi:hypothetical protein
MIVEQAHRAKTEPALQFLGINNPRRIGEHATPAIHRSGDGKDGIFDGCPAGHRQEVLDRVAHASVSLDVERSDRSKLAARQHGEPCVSAADVGQKGALHRTARVASARISSAYHRAEAFGMRRCVG